VVEISYRFGFEAAHHFAHFPPGHPNHGVHGHSFQVEVALRGKPDPATGFAVEFGEIERACAALRARLDHRLLNDVQDLGPPSLEHLSIWIWRQLALQLPGLARVTVRRDSCGQSCTYTGQEA
jgi:6-pyruvoyltetrahydropterin/6-carboxytetrahydropterin synthase